MARLAGFLLPLLSAASLLGATEKNESLQVKQDPPQIQAWPGDSVELPCQILTAKPWARLRVEWQQDNDLKTLCWVLLYNGSASNCCRGPGGCDSRFGFTWHPPTFTLWMGNASTGDAGRYVCLVTLEIPEILKAEGNGTILNISAAGEGGALRNLIGDPVFWLGLAGGLAVVGLLPAVICCYKHKCRNPGQQIYVNVLYRQKQAEKKAGDQAQSKMKQSSIYTLEFQGGGHSRKPPVAGQSPIPTKAPKQASSFQQRATKRP
ncbi:transmembrane and immunoglobulin domain-containing protein 2 [Pelodiscus sinensis]|uniref:transmembrane and immunoglobulin domain-containing protein 2 n=1 Tax=Pelodiscus sinensis TaxID=13735 RepID=UPI003F6B2D4B